MSVLQQLDHCLAALDDLSTNLDINLKLFWHLGYFWIVFLYWQIFKIKFFFPFKSSRIVKRISGSKWVLRRLNLSPLCWPADTVTKARWPVSCCHVLPLMCHAPEPMSRILSQVPVVSAVLPRHAATSWKMEDGQRLGRKSRGHNVTTSFQESSTQSGQDAGVSLSSSNGHQRISLEDWQKPPYISKSWGFSSRDDDEWEVACCLN